MIRTRYTLNRDNDILNIVDVVDDQNQNIPILFDGLEIPTYQEVSSNIDGMITIRVCGYDIRFLSRVKEDESVAIGAIFINDFLSSNVIIDYQITGNSNCNYPKLAYDMAVENVKGF